IDHLGLQVVQAAVGALVAHEVRNLLTPAIAYTQLALSEQNPRGTLKSLEKTLVAMRRACEVSELVLAFVKNPPPDGSELPVPIDVAGMIVECVEALGWNDPAHSFRVQVNANKGHLAAIQGDSLRHVLLNLLLNARASLPDSGGRIEIAIEAG